MCTQRKIHYTELAVQLWGLTSLIAAGQASRLEPQGELMLMLESKDCSEGRIPYPHGILVFLS